MFFYLAVEPLQIGTDDIILQLDSLEPCQPAFHLYSHQEQQHKESLRIARQHGHKMQDYLSMMGQKLIEFYVSCDKIGVTVMDKAFGLINSGGESKSNKRQKTRFCPKPEASNDD